MFINILVMFINNIFILALHVPGLGDEATMQMSMVSLLKDMGLMAGALIYAGIFSEQE